MFGCMTLSYGVEIVCCSLREYQSDDGTSLILFVSYRRS